jgi:hypothetical protein
MTSSQEFLVFLTPVIRDYPSIAATYIQLISSPMDIETVQLKLTQNRYAGREDFDQDVLLMFDNCKVFNA